MTFANEEPALSFTTKLFHWGKLKATRITAI